MTEVQRSHTEALQREQLEAVKRRKEQQAQARREPNLSRDANFLRDLNSRVHVPGKLDHVTVVAYEAGQHGAGGHTHI